jgi:hypothetical protein
VDIVQMLSTRWPSRSPRPSSVGWLADFAGRPRISRPAKPGEKPPPFNPDPDLVMFLERGRRDDPKRVWEENRTSSITVTRKVLLGL